MKLYRDYAKGDWLDILSLHVHQVPKSMIIHGEWEPHENLKYWTHFFGEKAILPKWNTVIGSYKDRMIGFSNVYGSPMAANIVHQFAGAGTDLFIQSGYIGGLSDEIKYGDIIIVSEVELGEGVSKQYAPHFRTLKTKSELVQMAVMFCEQENIRYHVGKIHSTSSLLVETEEDITNWSQDGCLGVEMECGTTFAVAASFNKRAIGLFQISDHLIHGDSVFFSNEERDFIERETDEVIRKIALYLAEKG